MAIRDLTIKRSSNLVGNTTGAIAIQESTDIKLENISKHRNQSVIFNLKYGKCLADEILEELGRIYNTGIPLAKN